MFVVNGSNPMCSVSHRKATAREAVETALVIMGRGFPIVHIATSDGEFWEPKQFPNFLVTHRQSRALSKS
jgi:hypothetical protein